MKVSIVTACRNSDPGLLNRCITSVLKQSFSSFEYIIVDDGSDTPLEPIIRSISNDERIKTYRISPSGLGAALNYGIRNSKGEYIARIDDDDMMLPNRLDRQVSFMDAHPEVSCLGTQHFDLVGNRARKHRHYPESHEEMVKSMLSLRFPIAHTAMMYRRDCFDRIGGYRVAGGGQDVDLILQMGTVGRLANLPDYLTIYTMSYSGLGTINPNKYKAYLFAFEEIKRNKQYLQFQQTIDKSIRVLERKVANTKIKSHEIFSRKLLALRVWILGRNINQIINIE